MIAILSLLFVVTLSILITRIATVALSHTGMSKESARFQARSALTGAGFTTAESERVVNHPVRRRIILLLMLVGNAGVVSAVSSLILTFIDLNSVRMLWIKITLLTTGLTALWFFATSPWVDRRLSRLIEWALNRYTQLDVIDYASLMHLAGEYRIVEILIEPEDWIADKTLGESKLREEGIVVLGVKRKDGTYLGVPNGSTLIVAYDSLIAYGRASALEALDQRRRNVGGALEHLAAIAEHQQIAVDEQTGNSIPER